MWGSRLIACGLIGQRDSIGIEGASGTVKVKYAPKRTPENLALARRLRAEGKTLLQIATQIGISKTTAFFWLDPDYAKRRNRYMYGADTGAPTPQELARWDAMRYAARQTGEKLLRQVPKDTRTLAQQLMGEPIFERSALARRHRTSKH